MPSAFAMGTRVEQPGKFLSCASRAGRRDLEDLASSLHGLPSAVEDLQVVVPRRNWALLLQGEFFITLHEACPLAGRRKSGFLASPPGIPGIRSRGMKDLPAEK